MTAHTPTYGWPYPELTDPPDGATEPANLALAIDTSLAALAATVATNAGRAAIFAALVGNAGVGTRYDTRPTAITSVTSTAYVNLVETAGSALCGVSFVVPVSGAVTIEWGATAGSDALTITTALATRVATGNIVGSGATFSVESDTESAQITTGAGANLLTVARQRTVSGLTPGAIYNAWILWRIQTAAHTGRAQNPWITVRPEIAF